MCRPRVDKQEVSPNEEKKLNDVESEKRMPQPTRNWLPLLKMMKLKKDAFWKLYGIIKKFIPPECDLTGLHAPCLPLETTKVLHAQQNGL